MRVPPPWTVHRYICTSSYIYISAKAEIITSSWHCIVRRRERECWPGSVNYQPILNNNSRQKKTNIQPHSGLLSPPSIGKLINRIYFLTKEIWCNFSRHFLPLAWADSIQFYSEVCQPSISCISENCWFDCIYHISRGGYYDFLRPSPRFQGTKTSNPIIKLPNQNILIYCINNNNKIYSNTDIL